MNDTDLLLNVINTQNRALKEEMAAMKQASEDRHVEVMNLITKAFPDGDLASHYQYHMRLIEEAAARKAIRLEVWKKIVSMSAWTLLGFIGLKSLEWVRDNVKF